MSSQGVVHADGAALFHGDAHRVEHSREAREDASEEVQGDVVIAPGTHSSERAVNKQLNDKERVAAALENVNLLEKVDLCLSGKTAV